MTELFPITIETQFERELATLINKHSMENGSNTPDFILAEYLSMCMEAFNKTSRAREKWYGKSLSINMDDDDDRDQEEEDDIRYKGEDIDEINK